MGRLVPAFCGNPVYHSHTRMSNHVTRFLANNLPLVDHQHPRSRARAKSCGIVNAAGDSVSIVPSPRWRTIRTITRPSPPLRASHTPPTTDKRPVHDVTHVTPDSLPHFRPRSSTMSAMSDMIRDRVVVVDTDGLVETGLMPQRALSARIATNQSNRAVHPKGGERARTDSNGQTNTKGAIMPRSTRNNPQTPQRDKSDNPVEPATDSPETDEVVNPPESVIESTTDEVVESDAAPETDEPAIPALPDNWVADNPLVAHAYNLVIAGEAAKEAPTPLTDFVGNADKMF